LREPRHAGTKLSTRCVEAVRAALQGAGVPKENILTGSYGELNRKCDSKNEECWKQDRRVEVIMVPGPAAGEASASPGRRSSAPDRTARRLFSAFREW
jgi:hypothetical protein